MNVVLGANHAPISTQLMPPFVHLRSVAMKARASSNYFMGIEAAETRLRGARNVCVNNVFRPFFTPVKKVTNHEPSSITNLSLSIYSSRQLLRP